MLRSWLLMVLLVGFAWVVFPQILPLTPLPSSTASLQPTAVAALGEPAHRPVTVRLRPDLAALDWLMQQGLSQSEHTAVAAPFRITHPGQGQAWVSGRGALLGVEIAAERPRAEVARREAAHWIARLGVTGELVEESRGAGELRFGVREGADRALVRWRGGTLLARRLVLVPQPARDAWRERRSLAEGLAGLGVALAVLGGVLVVWTARGRQRRWRYGAVLGVVVLLAVLPAPLLQFSRFVEPWDPSVQAWWQVWLSGAGQRAFQWSLAALGVGLCMAWLGSMPDDGRGRTFDKLLRAQLDVEVARDLERGMLLSLVLGVAAASVVAVAGKLGVPPVLQPAHTLLTFYDVQAPWLLVPTFALFAALTEELIYHHGVTRALLVSGRSRLVAVLIPAVVYGLIHAPLTFIPPADPLWRVGIATAAGIAWGVAYLRFGVLTVITSHGVADVLLFGWPHVMSGRSSAWFGLVLVAILASLGRLRSLRQRDNAVAAGADEHVDHTTA